MESASSRYMRIAIFAVNILLCTIIIYAVHSSRDTFLFFNSSLSLLIIALLVTFNIVTAVFIFAITSPDISRDKQHYNENIYTEFHKSLLNLIANESNIDRNLLSIIFCGTVKIPQMRPHQSAILATYLQRFIKEMAGEKLNNQVKETIICIIGEIQEEDPFSGVPENERTVLSDIRRLTSGDFKHAKIITDKLQILATAIKSQNEHIKKADGKSLKYALIGIICTVIFGVTSLVLSVYIYKNSPSVATRHLTTLDNNAIKKP